MRDLFNNIDLKRGLSPVAATTDNTVYTSQKLDMANVQSAVFAFLLGSLADADATFAVTAKESDTGAFGGEETDVAAGDLLGDLATASFTFAADDTVRKLGFRRSGKRYKLVKVTPANNTGNAFIAGLWITSPGIKPTDNPPT